MSTISDDQTNDPFGGSDVPSPTESMLNAVFDEFDPNEGIQIDLSPPILLSDINNTSSHGFPPEFNENSTSQDPFATIFQAAAFPSEMQSPPRPSDRLKIIEQPYCSSKVRYRKDYLPPSTRREPLMNKTPSSNYKGPAVCIPSTYLDIARQYYIGVSLVTLLHQKTNCCYIHPYELESIDYIDRNDRDNNIVWYPIRFEDRNGNKSFPDIRIVRKTEEELGNHGHLRPFHGYTSNLLNTVVLSKRKIVPEYNLKKAQLAFFIGQKVNVTDIFPTIIDSSLTILSDEMTLVPDQETAEDNDSPESAAKASPPPPPECGMPKYAPRYGYVEGNDEMLIFYTKKLEEKKYGKLQITFESNTPDIDWSADVDAASIEVKDQMVSFRTPKFLASTNARTAVKIILRQRDRVLKPLDYFYIQKSQCLTCQAHAMNTSNPITRNNANKRTKRTCQMDSGETDAIVPVFESNPVFRQSKSEPESNSSNSTSRSSINSSQTKPDEDPLLKKLHESIELLFSNNDFKPVLRICRSFIRKHPELLHQAISNNYSDLISKFVSVAGTDLLQQKNQFGETVLLHATHLHRIDIIKAVLDRENSYTLLEDTTNKEQNIFHILALHANSDEIFDLFIDYLLKKSINIQEAFDHVDDDHHTPLQLAILNNNLPATRHLLKYFNKNVCETTNHIGENLIHLAVRFGDVTMLKYLLDDEQFIEQGHQTSLTMTPIELARSLKRQDMVEYLKEIYPQPEIDEDENSNSD